jgi:RNA polymerase-interacting CarD/CdnL/TRCF family regulator
MPHFAAVRPDERLNVLGMVRATLKANFFDKKLVHEDVAWRNIGLYKKVGSVSPAAVVFDLGRVETNQTAHDYDANWVDNAISKLEKEA